MQCPLCATPLRQNLLQPSISLISCPSVSCIFPFNLSINELHDNNLILSNITTSDIMSNMKSRMVDDANVDPQIANFITREDHDII